MLVSMEKRLMGRPIGLGFFAEGDVKIENKLVLNKVVGQTDNTYSFPTTRDQMAKYCPCLLHQEN